MDFSDIRRGNIIWGVGLLVFGMFVLGAFYFLTKERSQVSLEEYVKDSVAESTRELIQALSVTSEPKMSIEESQKIIEALSVSPAKPVSVSDDTEQLLSNLNAPSP